MFIAFEGIDGSGKTTQAKLLYRHLRRAGRCVFTDEPTEGMIGTYIHSLLRQKRRLEPLALQLLFTADRAEHVTNFILPKIKAGYSVITDRYMFSTIAYGAASGANAKTLEDASSAFPLPDATFVIDVDLDTAMKRMGKRGGKREYFERGKFLERARGEFRRMAKRYPNYFLIDGSGTIEEISAKVFRIADKLQRVEKNARSAGKV